MHSDDRLLADTYYLLGQANYYEDRDSQAAQYFEKALPLLRELGDKQWRGQLHQEVWAMWR